MVQRKARKGRGGYRPNPTIIEKELIAQATSLSPQQLKIEIERMRMKVNERIDTAANFRLAIYLEVYISRDDCGPLGKEILVRSTS